MKTQVRNTRLKVTEENITKLAENEVFVFGSNLAGIHGGGAALQAKNSFGAVLGVGEGLTGQCYALPTKDKNIETLSLNEIRKSIEVLLNVVKENKNKMFKITAIGCGLAGYEAKNIAPMFESFICLNNISLPQSFIDVIFPKVIKGYKVTNSEMKCRDLKFTLNKKMKVKGDIVICNNGLHFCKELINCFNYYDFNSNNRVFEVEGYGNFDYEEDKVCMSEIKFLRELTWFEVLKLSNTGNSNTGYNNTGNNNTGSRNTGCSNTGDSNTGYRNTGYNNTGSRNTGHNNTGNSNTGNNNTGCSNTGDSNTGDSNTGSRNTGYNNTGSSNTGNSNTENSNTGDSNTGYRNTGHNNTGSRNTGNSNTGNSNTGDSNTGNSNTGYNNTGYRNTGYSNTGDSNTGDSNRGDSNTGNNNTGDSNTGNNNTGDSNTGDSNTGYRNTGYNNTGSRNTGCFNTNEPNARMFNKPCDKKMSEINIPYLYIPLTQWIDSIHMTNEEKQNNFNFYVQNGYLKTNDYKVAWSIAWRGASQSKKQEFLDLPNFDAEIFEKITGIKIY